MGIVTTRAFKRFETHHASGPEGRDNFRATEKRHAESHEASGNTHGDKAASRRKRGRKRGPRSVGRYPFLAELKRYAKVLPHVVAEQTADEYVRKLRYIHDILQLMRERGEIDTTSPAKLGEREIYALDSWMRHPEAYLLPRSRRREKQKGVTQSGEAFGPVYRNKLWGYLERFLAFCHNPVLEEMEQAGTWKRPRVAPTKETKDEAWFRDAESKLDPLEGWQAIVVRFCLEFFWYTAVRSKEMRLADVADLDLEGRVFRVMHPKGEGVYGTVGAEVDLFDELLPHARTFLEARERHLRLYGLDPQKVRPLVPNERGEHYNDKTWSGMRYKTFRTVGIRGNYRILRKSSLQSFTDALTKNGYKEGAVSELVAMRGRHSIATTLKDYVVVKQGRVREAVREVSRNRGPSGEPRGQDPPAKSLTERLEELEAAHAKGLLTDEERRTYRRLVLEAIVPPSSPSQRPPSP